VDAAPPVASVRHSPWRWVPSLYFAQGVPYVVVMTVAVIALKRLGVSNAQTTIYTSALYLPYAIKPLWSPLVQRLGTRRGWVLAMQLLVGAGLAAAAVAISSDDFVGYTLAALALVAVSSATHDVAADGFYLLALTGHEQAWFVGIRSVAYRFATIAGQGLLVMLAGYLESATGLPTVDVTVTAGDRPAAEAPFAPAEFAAASDAGEQRIAVAQDNIELGLSGRDPASAKALLAAVQRWNVDHGFYPPPEPPGAAAKKAPWVDMLEKTIRSQFGPREAVTAPTANAGDLAVVLMRLTQPVEDGAQQVVQIGRTHGDADLQVVEGERFVVTADNWDQPFAAVVQVDAKRRDAARAEFQVRSGNLPLAWTATFFLAAGVFLALCAYHTVALPRPAADAVHAAGGNWLAEFFGPFAAFFRKHRVTAILAFLLLYRLAEAQAVKLVTPFLLDAREKGGLALTTAEVGLVYGTFGIAMLMLGGVLGGFAAARDGLKRWLWPMVLAIHLPNLAFLFLAYVQPESLWAIAAAVGVEQFGYGFGFTAYLLYCVYVARGEFETVHYALCTGCMALGMMIPGMWSGWLQQLIGYQHFFVWIMLCTLPSFVAAALIPLDPEFGKKHASA
jgi:PAT family beta-lactamase induction signal transducer AmpG